MTSKTGEETADVTDIVVLRGLLTVRLGVLVVEDAAMAVENGRVTAIKGVLVLVPTARAEDSRRMTARIGPPVAEYTWIAVVRTRPQTKVTVLEVALVIWIAVPNGLVTPNAGEETALATPMAVISFHKKPKVGEETALATLIAVVSCQVWVYL